MCSSCIELQVDCEVIYFILHTAINVIYLGTINAERVNDPNSLSLCVDELISCVSHDEPIPISFKAFEEGITLTDVNQV